MSKPSATIHLFTPGALPLDLAASLLDDAETSRAARFRFEADATHWTQCRAALRLALASATSLPPASFHFETTPFGKPYLTNAPHFNLSHCRDLALIAICHHFPVGIDLEPADRAADLLDCETTFCHPREIASLPTEAEPRTRQLLRIWTAKEAFLKALGTGLSHPPQEVFVDFPSHRALSDSPLPGLDRLKLHELLAPPLTRHIAMLAADESIASITVA